MTLAIQIGVWVVIAALVVGLALCGAAKKPEPRRPWERE